MIPSDERARHLARLRPRMMARARRMTRRPEDAEDLVQEALLRVWSRLAAQQTIDDLDAYLAVTLRHLAQRREPAHADDTAILPDPAAPPETRVFAGEVVAALDTLPAAEARLISAVALKGLSYAEAARAEGVPLGTVMSRLARGRARLRHRLKIAGPLQGP